VDDGFFFEIRPRFARNMVTGFARVGGYSVGFVANQPKYLGGSLDVDCSDKGSRFIRFCDAFNIPIITLVDMPGYLPGTKQEQLGIIRHGAKMLYAYAESTVPMLTLYLRKGYGGAKQAMCTREMGADQVFVWPGVELAVMGASGAVSVLYRQEIERSEEPDKTRQEKMEEFTERFTGPFEAVSKGFAHAAVLALVPGAGIIPQQERRAPAPEARPHARLIRAARVRERANEETTPRKGEHLIGLTPGRAWPQRGPACWRASASGGCSVSGRGTPAPSRSRL